MKLVKNAAFVVCLVASISLQAQKKNDEKTKFIPPVIVKDEDKSTKSEEKKKEYKSKQWHQGDENVLEETKNAGKNKAGIKRKYGKVRPVPPPPPPAPPVPPAPPAPSLKENS